MNTKNQTTRAVQNNTETTSIVCRNIQIGIGNTITIVIAIIAVFITMLMWLRSDIQTDIQNTENRLNDRVDRIEGKIDRLLEG